MKNRRGQGIHFPRYLKPGRDDVVLRWLGNRLKSVRGKEAPKNVAERAATPVDQIKAIEGGQFQPSLGQLREIIERGFRVSLADLLAECYEAFRERFDPDSTTSGRRRPFDRDCHYSLCLEASRDGKEKSTPLLIGGDPDNYLWAIPMRRLKGQPLATELLELAPSRKLKRSGVTPDNPHVGVEVIHVIFGTVEAKLSFSGEAPIKRRLKAGDSIHFHARNPHQIENVEKGSSALLLVVRLPHLPNEKGTVTGSSDEPK